MVEYDSGSAPNGNPKADCGRFDERDGDDARL